MARFENPKLSTSDFLKINKLFLAGLVIVTGLSLFLVYSYGFRAMVNQIADQPERLRDITFPIWDRFPASRHGYLAFLSPSDFDKGLAYSNHSSLYLLWMYFLYKIENIFPGLPMRVTAAFLNALSLVAVVAFLASSVQKKRIELCQGTLFLLSIAFMLTMPGFWISAGRFNVDNPFPLMFSALILVAFFIARDKCSGPRVLVLVLFFSFLAPTAAVLLGVFLLLLAIREGGADRQAIKIAMLTILVGALVFLQPVIISKLLGFKASNSSWLFRSGLDGDRTYFSNIWRSIFYPYFPRPPYLLLVPIALLSIQILTIARKSSPPTWSLPSLDWNANAFFPLLFSQYILICLFWPQAVAIHPYLYDHVLLAPICVWISLNFFEHRPLQERWRLWALLLMFLISFNLQQIAQAKCAGCYYPAWAGSQLKLQ